MKPVEYIFSAIQEHYPESYALLQSTDFDFNGLSVNPDDLCDDQAAWINQSFAWVDELIADFAHLKENASFDDFLQYYNEAVHFYIAKPETFKLLFLVALVKVKDWGEELTVYYDPCPEHKLH
ncbi:hypothetical protein AVI51_11305 [Piscirickettsia salmonis]|uniref:Cinnamoyl-CoA:phenyllactate CoA-transferase n=1 Tax=Piscirickettsia salmonis TaxID=1238 RepID=A0A095BPU6_PISSA|nr:hypothetical protein [Piscirickettsia salmonis]RNC79118.1 hypothetical protein DA717_00650 [Piscirickettsiaceae bacterium NZ-RLO2]AKP74748.1 hypothetical protein PSLF89_3263 [Piscirickettsia salmonis LF-89 = ATCC VR-1361]ALA26400.1 cinnamoyl-CoA:phenyllactate CoA-transferase [Piscirickettsia salmonis]ALB21323.1 cinnamoyl-CoA:phenyllactate CoA-transferase [Piscirickettsia salmonis]ALY01562.1 hypothetical protein AWE47_00660 [Piscirickettsia salmonis]